MLISILLLPFDICYLIIGSALTAFLVLIEMGCCESCSKPKPPDLPARLSVSSTSPFISSPGDDHDVVTSDSHVSLTSLKENSESTDLSLLSDDDEVSPTFDIGVTNHVSNQLSSMSTQPSPDAAPESTKAKTQSCVAAKNWTELPKIHSDQLIPPLELWKSVDKMFGSHSNSNSSGVVRKAQSTSAVIGEETLNYTRTHSSNTVSAKNTDEMDLSFLAPVCKISDKEVVVMGDETTLLKEETQYIDNLLYLIIAFRLFELLVTPMSVSALSSHALESTEQMRNALNRIIANSFHLRIKVFVMHFNKVFHVQDELVSRHARGEEWLEVSVIATLKGLLQDFIKLGKKSLPDLCKYLTMSFGATDIPWFGAVSEDNLNAFILSCDNLFGIANDVVFLMPSVNKPSHNFDQNSGKQVSSFFKKILKSSAIPYTELSLVVSRESPELLAALVDRTPNGLLTLLLKDGSFKCEQGMVMLKGFVPVSPKKPVSQEPPQPQIHSSKETSPSKMLHELQNGHREEVTGTGSVKTAVCICSSGIVMCVGKTRVTFWCSQSDVCKNIFVMGRRSKTVVDGILDRDFLTVFKEGDRVIFTHETSDGEGWTIEYALHVKLVSDPVWQTSCLCPVKGDVANYHHQVTISNGVPFQNQCTFFWNCKGTVINMMNTKGIAKCKLNDASDRYFLAYFTNCTWFVGFDPKEKFTSYLTLGDNVEVDIVLQNFRKMGTLTWYCLCLRKLSNTRTKSPPNIIWNCTGRVFCVLSDHYTLSIDDSNETESKLLAAKYYKPPYHAAAFFQNIYLHEDGSAVTQLTPHLLQFNEKVTFDAVLGQPCTAMFLRKCKRPDVTETSKLTNRNGPTLNGSMVVAVKLKEELSTEVPFFDTLSKTCTGNSLTFGECREVLDQCPEIAQLCRKIPVEYLSRSERRYQSSSCKTLTDSACQTISTGPVFSALSPSS